MPYSKREKRNKGFLDLSARVLNNQAPKENPIRNVARIVVKA